MRWLRTVSQKSKNASPVSQSETRIYSREITCRRADREVSGTDGIDFLINLRSPNNQPVGGSTEGKSNNVKAQDDLQRYKRLVEKQNVSKQTYGQAVAARKPARRSKYWS